MRWKLKGSCAPRSSGGWGVFSGCGRARAVVGDELEDGQVDLADEQALAGILVEQGAHLEDDFVGLGLVGGVGRQHGVEAVAGGVGGVGQVVAELVVLDEQPENVHAEAVDALVEPELHGAVHGAADFGVAPVEVGLLGQEGVVEGLARGPVVGPGGAAEIRLPVVGRRAVRAGVAPQVPVALGIWCARNARRGTRDAGRTCGWGRNRG